MTEPLSRFGSNYPFALDEFQISGCESVAQGRSVLVAAPTGAGKTVVGEFACWLAVEQGRKCFYTTPIKALSNQKYRDLIDQHGPESVGLVTGDQVINSQAPILVMTTEILRNMIYAKSDTLANLGFVVMDEVHYLADRSRGAVWEEIIITCAADVQLICLSATVSNAEEFAEWLAQVRGDVDVVVTEDRPVPLTAHVFAGAASYDLFVDGRINPELHRLAREEARFVRDDSRRPVRRGGQRGRPGNRRRSSRAPRSPIRTPSRAQVVGKLERAKMLPAIVFVFSRGGCDAAVAQLASTDLVLTNQFEADELVALADFCTLDLTESEKAALGYRAFRSALSRGFAAHHAGLLPAFKQIIERGFSAGWLKVVFATETLALGINMPARTVVIEKLVKYNGETHADITPGEFTQLTGRAGRRGIDTEGHAVVLWQPGTDPNAVASLAAKRTYPLNSSFAPGYNMAVNLIETVGRDHARRLLERSFAQFQVDRAVTGTTNTVAKRETQIAEQWQRAHCAKGDFTEYARLAEQIRRLEREQSRTRRAQAREIVADGIQRLQVGDIVALRRKAAPWAVIVALSRGGDVPIAVGADRSRMKLTVTDFNGAPNVIGNVRVPKRFHPKDPASRKRLIEAAAAEIPDELPPVDTARVEADLGEVSELRKQLRQHPCHACPDREKHLRIAEPLLRTERRMANERERVERRSTSIASRFDRVCDLLTEIEYLTAEPVRVTDSGKQLARINAETDLVTVEALNSGLFSGLTVPQFAALCSALVYEPRPGGGAIDRMPDVQTQSAYRALVSVWQRIVRMERRRNLPTTRRPDPGFAAAAHAWADGDSLADVIAIAEVSPGDLVRWLRQVIDLAAQIASATADESVRTVARNAVADMRRGIIEVD